MSSDDDASGNAAAARDDGGTTLSYEPVFLLAGQSNMVGRCDAADVPSSSLPVPPATVHHQQHACDDDLRTTTTTTTGGVQFSFNWNNDSNFDAPSSSHGHFRPLQYQPSPAIGLHAAFGPEMGIVQTLGPRLNQERGVKAAHLLKFAMGSTNLHSNWNPTNDCHEGKPAAIGHYNRFIHFCRTALEGLNNRGDDISNQSSSGSVSGALPKKLVGMFWLQGESDSSKAKDANAYLSNFVAFTQAVKRDLNCHTDDSFVVVTSPVIWPRGKKVHIVNQALEQAGQSGGCICIAPIDPSSLEGNVIQEADASRPASADHLTGAAVLDVGKRMGLAFPVTEMPS